MRLRGPVSVAVALGVSLLSSTTLAFKEAGHRSIEAAAYEELLLSKARYCPPRDPATCNPGKNHAFCQDTGGAPIEACDSASDPAACRARADECLDDKKVITTLIERGVLSPPDRPFPTRSEKFYPDFDRFTVEGLVVQSHMPDHLFDRQLEADRQCFHFNARGGHMTLTEHQYWGIPEGLVKDAYLECLGLVDGLLRGVLYDPRQAARDDSGMYVLIHAIEDSFADSHVARDENYNILYVKPWNLRTWPRYFLSNTRGRVTRSHFSEEHHMGSDTRDLGYLLGSHDENYPGEPRDSDENDHPRRDYAKRVGRCLRLADVRLRRYAEDQRGGEWQATKLVDLEGEVIVPSECLSDRGQRAARAVADMMRLVAWQSLHVKPATVAGTREAVHFRDGWLHYRRAHLNHRLEELTRTMTIGFVPACRGGDRYPSCTRPQAPPPADLDRVRADFVYPADDLKPRRFRTAGGGLTTELRSGTPLWIGLDLFQTRNSANHNRTLLLLDSLGWGVQVRLPLENELGERPVGVAFDIGPGLPIPLSELVGLDELQIFIGARLRATYTAQSIFESETRHALAVGFGGASVDFIVGGHVWFGFDAPRILYTYDFWEQRGRTEPVIWSFSGGLATDAF